ncbi:MAG: phosphoribosylglycinamide formyltransferase [Bacillota bacterium]|nr:phosphoribosylglycinamide formyltransferase [Bacillota bacterium]
MAMMQVVVLASGKGSNLQAIIDAIAVEGLPVKIVGIISDNKSAYALQRGIKHSIPVYFLNPQDASSRTEYDQQLIELCQSLKPDYICLAGYMRLLGRNFVERFGNRIINIHPSLLPAFPGLNAQEQAYSYGVKVTGCTIHFVDQGMDTGPIIAQESVTVSDEDTLERLSQRILEAEHRLYPKVLRLLAENKVQLQGRKVTISCK